MKIGKHFSNSFILKLLLFIMIAGLGLRVPISYIPPMSQEIIDDLKISHSTFGLLTSLSPLCFFLFSPLTPYFESKIGLYKTLLMTFIVAIVAYFLRLNSSLILLLTSTVMFGFAIGLGNIALPSFFKSLGSSRVALLSSCYTASLYLGPAMATGLTLPVKHIFGFSWNGVSWIWILIPIFSLLLILLFSDKKSRASDSSPHSPGNYDDKPDKVINPWVSIPCWVMAVYFSILSLNFYIITAWFPEIISSYGLGQTEAASYAALFSLIAIPFATLTAFYIYKIKRQEIMFIINPIIGMLGIVLFVYGQKSLIPVAVMIMGIGAGICTGVAFLLPLLRFNHTANVTRANSMIQSIGYLIAFCGPVVSGYIHDLTSSWSIVMWMLFIILAIQGILGIVIGKNEKLDAK
ncbi:CynX/NimT family MFS transporter [Xenorhabdus budapestensis]|uniref:MFS transporter n=1 Tax=Xenorhabdus budapestensis TaxID=290110 RepID=A0A2D0J5Y9_XENBU|nr:MFS transporter [Xenorhabdus budapestensis]PHM29960.1 QbsM [Xenorhabdus budapestensis]QTL38740.1 MFS transporter [Xenorhabdus budapestensis]